MSIYPSGTASANTQVDDVSRHLSLVISVEPNHNTDLVNPTLRETVRNPNAEVISTNEFTKQFLTTIKPDVIGKYTLAIDNLGAKLVSVGILFGNLAFVGQNNQLNPNLFGGLVTGGILAVAGIIALIVGPVVLIVDRRRITRNKTTGT